MSGENPQTAPLNELKKRIVKEIEAFEASTGFLVQSKMELVRGGSTDSVPHKIYGIHLAITTNQ